MPSPVDGRVVVEETPVPELMVALKLIVVDGPVPPDGNGVVVLLTDEVEDIVEFESVLASVGRGGRLPAPSVPVPALFVAFVSGPPVPVSVGRVALLAPVPVGKGAVLFQSSHGDDAAGPPVQVLSRVHVLFASVQHVDPDAVGAKEVTLDEMVPLGNPVPVGWILAVPFKLMVPVGDDEAVGCEMVPLEKGGDDAVLMGPITLPSSVVDELALQQPVLETQIELVTVEVTR